MDNISTEPAQTYLQLRTRILNLDPTQAGLTPSSIAPHVWGVLMEIGYDVGTASLVSLADGTTSLYYSTGGGMLGSAEYSPVADASRALIVEAEGLLQHLSSLDTIPLPDVGQVRFIVLTYSGAFGAMASEQALSQGNHLLSALYRYAHETLRQLYLAEGKKQK